MAATALAPFVLAPALGLGPFGAVAAIGNAPVSTTPPS
jgi:hypothetical protein